MRSEFLYLTFNSADDEHVSGSLSAFKQLAPCASCRLSVVHQLVDVVDQRKQLPLPVHFRLATQGEAIESLVVADIAEDRFDCGEALSVLLAPLRAVDTFAHALGVSVFRDAREYGNLA